MGNGEAREALGPPRLATGVLGLDAVLGGGIPVGRTCLVAGSPGVGKTTLGNQLAFYHAAAGGQALVTTLLSETHDLMLANLRGFRFFDAKLVGERVHYLNILDALVEEGLDGIIAAVRRVARERGATLLVIDGAAVIDDLAPSQLDLRRFVQQLQAQAAILGATTVLLTSHTREQLEILGAHVDGVLVLANERFDARHVRQLEVLKLRGGRHVTGAHEFLINEDGITVHPRLESVVGWRRPPEQPSELLGTGVAGLDAMLGGGLIPFSSTLLMGTPGAGKTLLGLSYLLEGARRGERGLLAGFHETEAGLMSTAARIGLDLQGAIESGLIDIQWEPPLELSADAWAWRLLTAVEEHRPRRVFIDALTDIQRFIASPQRMPTFTAALTNELRALGTTVLIATEIDAYVDEQLVVPIPAASATMDNGLLVRQVEIRSSLLRLISILKARQIGTDPVIREFVIGDQGITVSQPFSAATGLLTGRVAAGDSLAGTDAP
ncbi:MAG TPA: ATPase domain-containing protein [Thermomicrobiales bacterium]|nr:ATPase domain-containing protein [Thermomicrobiales bacterium]